MRELVSVDGETTARESVARAALIEIAKPGTVGELLSEVVEGDGLVTLRFHAAMSGYPGWSWTVSLAELPGEEPSVLETELMPGDGALLAPDWVPWSDRLEEYRAAQAAAGEEVVEEVDDADADDLDDDDLDDEDLDDDDLDDDEITLRRGGKRDGIEIDFLAEEPSDLLAVSEDEQHEAEAEPEERGPQKPRTPRRQKRTQEEQ
jgi:hypothetical protein